MMFLLGGGSLISEFEDLCCRLLSMESMLSLPRDRSSPPAKFAAERFFADRCRPVWGNSVELVSSARVLLLAARLPLKYCFVKYCVSVFSLSAVRSSFHFWVTDCYLERGRLLRLRAVEGCEVRGKRHFGGGLVEVEQVLLEEVRGVFEEQVVDERVLREVEVQVSGDAQLRAFGEVQVENVLLDLFLDLVEVVGGVVEVVWYEPGLPLMSLLFFMSVRPVLVPLPEN